MTEKGKKEKHEEQVQFAAVNPPAPMRASPLLLALLLTAAATAQPVRPAWDVVRYGVAADELTPGDVALRLGRSADRPAEAGLTEARPVADRLAVVGAVTVPLAAGGALLGYTDGLQNQLRWCVDGARYAAPECRAINDDLHATAAAGRGLVVVAVAAASASAVAADVEPLEAGLVTLSASATAGIAFNLGHNLAEGQPYWYYGEVAATDQLARRLGPQTTFWVSAGLTVAIVAVTVAVLR